MKNMLYINSNIANYNIITKPSIIFLNTLLLRLFMLKYNY